jgi:2-dehydropantoate 2-reductase
MNTHPIKTVSIFGAGAMGASYAGILYEMDRESVHFVAGGNRYEQLSRKGIIVNGVHYTIPVMTPDDQNTPGDDLVIVAVKYHHLPQTIEDMKNRIVKNTIIISVMNGIDSEEQIGAAFGMERVLYATAVGIDAVRQENSVIYSTQGKIYFGEPKNIIISERVKRLKSFFDRAGIFYEIPEDMIHILWWKFMVNVGINQASAALKATYGDFQTSPAARNLMESAMKEVIQIAKAEGIQLSEDDTAKWYQVLSGLSPSGKTSMLQDVEAGRKTEVEMFAGKILELGRKYNIPTPVNERLFKTIREIERNGDKR